MPFWMIPLNAGARKNVAPGLLGFIATNKCKQERCKLMLGDLRKAYIRNATYKHGNN